MGLFTKRPDQTDDSDEMPLRGVLPPPNSIPAATRSREKDGVRVTAADPNVSPSAVIERHPSPGMSSPPPLPLPSNLPSPSPTAQAVQTAQSASALPFGIDDAMRL